MDLNPLINPAHKRVEIRKGLLVYYAPWCGFCKAFKNDLNELANHTKVSAIDISSPSFDIEAERKGLELTTVPAIFYVNGQQAVKYKGTRAWKDILAWANKQEKINTT